MTSNSVFNFLNHIVCQIDGGFITLKNLSTPIIKKFIAYMVIGVTLCTSPMVMAAQSGENRLPLEPCHIVAVEELAECGTIKLPENHNDPDGKKIDIHVTVLPPSGGQPTKEPLYFLAGGPGQGASELGDLYSLILRTSRQGRKLVLIDQRGTGKSHPFHCPQSQNPLESGDIVAAACLKDAKHDPRFYTSDAFIKDIETIRAELGHEKISIMGISYGTRAGLLYAKAHADRVSALVLDSVAPPHIPAYLNDALYAENILNKTIDKCIETEECRSAFPTLKSDFAALLTNLKASPLDLRVLEGDGFTLTVDDTLFLTGFRGPLYAPPTARIIPFIIHEAHKGNFEPWLAITDFGNQETSGGIATGLFLSVQCAEEIPPLKQQEQNIAETKFPSAYISTLRDACSVWPTGEVPSDFNAPVKVTTPTLLLSGGLDPITPPALGEAAAQYLPNSIHLVADNVGHSVTGNGCSERLISEFLDHKDPARIEGECLNEISRPAFVIGRFGPNP